MRFLENLFKPNNHTATLPRISSKAAQNKFNLEPVEVNETDDCLLEENYTSEGPYCREFDNGPTELYAQIQLKRWAWALSSLQKNPKQAKIWIHRLSDDGKTVRWRILPLHAALILKAPDNVIEALLRANRFAAKAKDDQGSLPLHIVCKVGASKKVAEMLVAVYAQAVIERDGLGRYPAALLDVFAPVQKQQIFAAIDKQLSEFKQKLSKREVPESREQISSARATPDTARTQATQDYSTMVSVSTGNTTSRSSNIILNKEPEMILKDVQEKHKEQLSAAKETMEMRDHASLVGEEIDLKSKISDVQYAHMAELQKLEHEVALERQLARAKEDRKLEAQLKQAEEKQQGLMKEMEMVKRVAEAKGGPPSELARIDEKIRQLKAQQVEEIRQIRQAAEKERQRAREEEGKAFQQRLKDFETKCRSAVNSIKAESRVSRERARALEHVKYEKKIRELEQAHREELQAAERKFEEQRSMMQRGQLDMFDQKLYEIQRKHAEDLKAFQHQLSITQEANRNERSRIIDSKIDQLQNDHAREIAKIEQRSLETIGELEETITSLKRDLAKAQTTSLSSNSLVHRSIQNMQKHMDDSTFQSTDQVRRLQTTVTSLEASLEESRKQGLLLEEHVRILEENLRMRLDRDREIDEQLRHMQSTCLCFEFGPYN